MKLRRIGPTTTVVEIGNTQFLFSYDTPVAARLSGGTFIRTQQFWSLTTSRHISQWLHGAQAVRVPQATLDAMTQ